MTAASTASVPPPAGQHGPPPAAGSRQAAVGLTLAAAIGAAWLALHVWGVFFHPLTPAGLAVAPLLVAVLTWLDVGLFIVAHDCMHGSLAPGRPRVNRAIGRVALALYAGFSFDRLLPKHHAHHRHAGTAADPDFDPRERHGFWRWYGRFFREYFGWREFAVLAALPWAYVLVLGAAVDPVVAAAVRVRHLPAAPARQRAVRRPAPRAQQRLRLARLAAHLLSLRLPLRASPAAGAAVVAPAAGTHAAMSSAAPTAPGRAPISRAIPAAWRA